jgi:hypothetical protein
MQHAEIPWRPWREHEGWVSRRGREEFHRGLSGSGG